jgi:hypothetical protein
MIQHCEADIVERLKPALQPYGNTFQRDCQQDLKGRPDTIPVALFLLLRKAIRARGDELGPSCDLETPSTRNFAFTRRSIKEARRVPVSSGRPNRSGDEHWSF